MYTRVSLMAQLVTGLPAMQETTCKTGDAASIPGSGRAVGEGNGKPLQYSCLENPMGGGAWKGAVHGVAESDMTERLHFHFHFLLHWRVGSLLAEPPRKPL